ncbi:MAG: GCN5-related N-acetyltransferase [uncultured bacterium]|nr:MAG: GCN5-related N-acetyltransferase [uncultured bacterium]
MEEKESPNIQIRPYTPEDYQSVKAIYEDGGLFAESIDTEENLKTKIERDPESILVAVKRQQVVGTVSFLEDGRMAYIFRVAVKKTERKQGIAKMLLEEAEKILKKRGLKKVSILVSEKVKELWDYYEGLGYNRGTMHLWMWKELK